MVVNMMLASYRIGNFPVSTMLIYSSRAFIPKIGHRDLRIKLGPHLNVNFVIYSQERLSLINNVNAEKVIIIDNFKKMDIIHHSFIKVKTIAQIIETNIKKNNNNNINNNN